MLLYKRVQRIKSQIENSLLWKPTVGIVLGTGLNSLAEKVEHACVFPYKHLFGFPRGAKGSFVYGVFGDKRVLVANGRMHYYDGFSLEDVTMPVRVMRAMGCESLIVTNAAGGINLNFNKGDIMVIEDHINLIGSPLVGPNDERLGPRFPDMSQPYHPELTEYIAKQFFLRKGTYVGVPGPQLETRAEYRALAGMWADAVGMSTVPEVIAAVHGGMKVLGLSVITDLCDPNNLAPANIEDIVATAQAAEPKLMEIVAEAVRIL